MKGHLQTFNARYLVFIVEKWLVNFVIIQIDAICGRMVRGTIVVPKWKPITESGWRERSSKRNNCNEIQSIMEENDIFEPS